MATTTPATTSTTRASTLTLDGMLNTKDTNAFAHAALFPDRLEITGFGRQESHSLKCR